MGQLHSCGAMSRDSLIGATVSRCHKEQKKVRMGDPVAGCLLLPDEFFCGLGARDGEKGGGETQKGYFY